MSYTTLFAYGWAAASPHDHVTKRLPQRSSIEPGTQHVSLSLARWPADAFAGAVADLDDTATAIPHAGAARCGLWDRGNVIDHVELSGCPVHCQVAGGVIWCGSGGGRSGRRRL
jgi:hypothetical protein